MSDFIDYIAILYKRISWCNPTGIMSDRHSQPCHRGSADRICRTYEEMDQTRKKSKIGFFLRLRPL